MTTQLLETVVNGAVPDFKLIDNICRTERLNQFEKIWSYKRHQISMDAAQVVSAANPANILFSSREDVQIARVVLASTELLYLNNCPTQNYGNMWYVGLVEMRRLLELVTAWPLTRPRTFNNMLIYLMKTSTLPQVSIHALSHYILTSMLYHLRRVRRYSTLTRMQEFMPTIGSNSY